MLAAFNLKGQARSGDGGIRRRLDGCLLSGCLTRWKLWGAILRAVMMLRACAISSGEAMVRTRSRISDSHRRPPSGLVEVSFPDRRIHPLLQIRLYQRHVTQGQILPTI
jgi:hypothetical protein